MINKPQILVVEDDVAIQDLLERRLRRVYEISCATYQDEAFAALQKSAFDLVLLDLKLPRNRLDLNPSPEVGIDILRQIRELKICRRGTSNPLPIVIMTAFGQDKLLSADFLQHRGPCDYTKKPFGNGAALKEKIEVALRDEGSHRGVVQASANIVQLRFNTAEEFVLVESVKYTGATYKLLRALQDIFVSDWQAQKPPDAFRKVSYKKLADILQIGEEAARRRVSTFRHRVIKDFKESLNRTLGKNDVIENSRNWDGYRLNPRVVHLVAWEQDMAVLPKRK